MNNAIRISLCTIFVILGIHAANAGGAGPLPHGLITGGKLAGYDPAVVTFGMRSQGLASGAEDQQRAPTPVNHVLAWPAPPGLESSKEYKVTINGVPVWVEYYEKRTDPDIAACSGTKAKAMPACPLASTRRR